MSVSKGSTWGSPGVLPAGAPVVDSDTTLHAIVGEWWQRGDGSAPSSPLVVGLRGGSLWEMLGGASVPGRLHTDAAMTYPCDLLVVRSDLGSTVAVSTVVARSRFWHHLTIAMNVQHLGPYRVGHRAHPGDGLVDVFDASLRPSELRKAAQRAKSGTHVPHPSITEKRTKQFERNFERPRRLDVDGSFLGYTKTLAISVQPDAFHVVV